jgi:hypothetical protein
VSGYSAVGPSSSGASATGATSLSFTHPGGAADTGVYLGVAVGNNADAGITASATFNSVAMTATPAKVETGSGGAGFLQCFKMESPPGGNQTVAISVTSASDISGGSISVTGSSGTGTPWSAANTGGSSTPATATSPGVIPVGDLVVAFNAAGQASLSATAPSTSRFILIGNVNTGAGNSAGATSPGTGATVTTAWTLTSADFWAVVGFDVINAAATSPRQPQPGSRLWRRRYHPRQQQAIVNISAAGPVTYNLTGGGMAVGAATGLLDQAVRSKAGGAMAVGMATGPRVVTRPRAGGAMAVGAGIGPRTVTLDRRGGAMAVGVGTGVRTVTRPRQGAGMAVGEGTGLLDRSVRDLAGGGMAVGLGLLLVPAGTLPQLMLCPLHPRLPAHQVTVTSSSVSRCHSPAGVTFWGSRLSVKT